MKHDQKIDTVAVIGAGVVGRGWLPVFVGGGCETRIFDLDEARSQTALDWCTAFLGRRVDRGELSHEEAHSQVGRMSICAALEDAMAGAQYVQESIPENLAIKRGLFAQLSRLAEPHVILASSTSSMNIEDIASGLANAGQCITAHPFNPAAILPVVEILGTRQADSMFVDKAVDFLQRLGQRPIRLNKFVKGYIGSRLQLALMREAFDIVENGIASTEAIDTLLSEGLALRWALLGTFGTNHTNADQGIRSYYRAYAHTIKHLMDDLTVQSPTFDTEMIKRFGREMDQRFSNVDVSQLCNWRDDVVSKIQALKASQPLPGQRSPVADLQIPSAVRPWAECD